MGQRGQLYRPAHADAAYARFRRAGARLPDPSAGHHLLAGGCAVVYERRTHKLLDRPAFLRRAWVHLFLALAIGAAAVGVGVLGYHVIGRLPWIDAFLNASMILGGMGPVDRMETTPAKLFAALY